MLSKAELNLSTDALTVEQAIEHALAVYEQNDCNMCGRQHKQLANWLTELLSLREQLAELKALPPFAWGLADKDGNAYLSECCIGDEGCMIDEAEGYNYELEPEHHIHAVPLFTAAKPAEIPRHIYSMLVNELRDVPAIGCKRELIIGVLNRHGITAEPVQFDPPAAK